MSNIRSRLVSTNQGASPGAATSLVIAPAGVDVTVLSFSGYCYLGSNTVQSWIMFFPQASIPANGAQPVFKQQVLGTNGFKFDYLPKGICANDFMSTNTAVPIPNAGGLIAVLSTTPETLTIATGGGNNMDLDVFIEEYETLQGGITVIGDTITAVKSLQVWSEAAGAGTNNTQGSKQLLKIVATNKSGATQYLQLFAQDAPVTNSANPALNTNVYIPQASNPVIGGAPVQSIAVNAQLVPIEEWTIPAETQTSGVLVVGTVYTITTFVAGDNFLNVGATSNATGTQFVATGTTPTNYSNGSTLTATPPALNLGDANSGIIPLSIDPGKTTVRKGCSLFVSTTAGYLTPPGGALWNIQAQYK
jgi:hypothetical protein